MESKQPDTAVAVSGCTIFIGKEVIMLPFIHFFGKAIPLYGLAWIVGIGLAAVAATLLCRRTELKQYDLVYSAVIAVIGGLIGSKAMFLLVSLPWILREHIPFEAVMRGGFVFYGGLIGGMVGLWLYLRVYKLPKLPFSDIFAVVLPLGHACGRVGCYLGGCCYGLPYDGPGCVVYTYSLGDTPLHTPLFPIQLVEAVCLLVLFAVLLVLYIKRVPDGVPTLVYLIGYAVTRFVLEFFRGDAVRGVNWLSTSQWISLGIVIFAVVCIAIHKKRNQATK